MYEGQGSDTADPYEVFWGEVSGNIWPGEKMVTWLSSREVCLSLQRESYRQKLKEHDLQSWWDAGSSDCTAWNTCQKYEAEQEGGGTDCPVFRNSAHPLSSCILSTAKAREVKSSWMGPIGEHCRQPGFQLFQAPTNSAADIRVLLASRNRHSSKLKVMVLNVWSQNYQHQHHPRGVLV